MHCDAAMLPRQSEKIVQEVQPALDDDLDPHPCEEDEEFFKARPNAEEMEQAISKFLDAMPSLETDNFQNLHRQLALLPLPNEEVVSSMTHDAAVEGGLMKTMSEEELRQFTPSELLLYKHAQEYRYIHVHILVHTSTY